MELEKSNIKKLDSLIEKMLHCQSDEVADCYTSSFLSIMNEDLLGEETFKEIKKKYPDMYCVTYNKKYLCKITEMYYYHFHMDESFNRKFKNHEQNFFGYLMKCLAMITSIIDNEEKKLNTMKLDSFLKNWYKIEEEELEDYSIRFFLLIMKKDLLGEKTLKEIKKIHPNRFFEIYKNDYFETILNKYCNLVHYESFNLNFGTTDNQKFHDYLKNCLNNIIIPLQFPNNQKSI